MKRGFFFFARQNTVNRERQRSNQTYRLEEEQRPNIIPLGVDDFVQHAEPEPLLPVRVLGVVDTVPQMPVVLFHDGDRTSRHASRSLRQATLLFCKYPHFHARSVSSVHRAGARSPENGDRDHADVWGCATHHTLETKFCLPPKKVPNKRDCGSSDRGGGGTQGGREREGGLTSDVRSDLHPELQLHTRIYAQYG